MIEYILYALSICIAVFVLNRYFSGTPFSGLRPNLEGYTAVITGGNAGIGR
jgi:hypothetical protein